MSHSGTVRNVGDGIERFAGGFVGMDGLDKQRARTGEDGESPVRVGKG